ncbi:hypothetical protein L227DRAFT_59361 [Lentinus tigrinus ALCF2SS1-6]|uniref:Uncharacterized protein n=1 Tax=Lentinus tigrinus ALCF2SS1-6 TaxID=1328759 RepID=A0A5C2SEN0_9APHY|nr:hypothetical protein L227DRAFT_59361 [Lentinus tigrinus ALCF2SS1-6]
MLSIGDRILLPQAQTLDSMISLAKRCESYGGTFLPSKEPRNATTKTDCESANVFRTERRTNLAEASCSRGVACMDAAARYITHSRNAASTPVHGRVVASLIQSMHTTLRFHSTQSKGTSGCIPHILAGSIMQDLSSPQATPRTSPRFNSPFSSPVYHVPTHSSSFPHAPCDPTDHALRNDIVGSVVSPHVRRRPPSRAPPHSFIQRPYPRHFRRPRSSWRVEQAPRP